MFRYKVHTLLIVLALGPPLIAVSYWTWKEWTRPPTAWGGMLLPNEVYGFAVPIDGTSPTMVVGAEDRPPDGWGIQKPLDRESSPCSVSQSATWC